MSFRASRGVGIQPTIGLASRTLHCFSGAAVTRAEYGTRGVQFRLVTTRSVVASVHGAARISHTVNVAAPVLRPGVLRVGCSCPVGEDGAACSHVLALLLVLDHRGLDLETSAISLTIEVERPWLDVEPPTAANGVVGLGSGPPRRDANDRFSIAAAATRVPRRGQGGSWADHVEWVDRNFPDAPSVPLLLEYHLTAHPGDGDELPDALPDRVEIIVCHRPPASADGGGGREPLMLHDRRPDGTLTAADRRALAALATAVPLGGDADGDDADEDDDTSRWTVGGVVHELFIDRCLQPLFATGRAGWIDPQLAGEPAPLQLLRWDADTPFRLVAQVRATAKSAALDATLVRGAERIRLAAIRACFGGGCVAVDDRLLYVEDGADLARWRATVGAAPKVVPREQLGRWVGRLAGAAERPTIEVDPATGWSVIDEIIPTPHLELEDAGDGVLAGQVVFRYGDVRRARDDTAAFVIDGVGQRLYRVARVHEDAQRQELLARCGHPSDRRAPEADVELAATRLGELLPGLDADGWHVWLRRARVRSGGRMSAAVATGIDWFDLTLRAEIGGEAVDATALVEALRSGHSLVRLTDGSHGVLPAEWLERHQALVRLGTLADGALRVPRVRALILDALLATVPEVDGDARFHKLRDRLHGFAGVQPRGEPPGFTGTLRPYQRDGLGWLGFLREVGFGGCLADDMGLGKTVQVLAALAEHRCGARAGRPWLVVAPKSVVFNWIDEASHFVAGARVLDYTGKDRARLRDQLAGADLVVTTYATLRLDIEALRDVEFDTVILDEAQAIKNPDAQISKAARLLRAEHRLALSGTPVENHLGDLGSIFEFLNPGMVGDVGVLRTLAGRTPDPRDGLAPLARALRPFVLRRTKVQVLPELPARTEQVLKCRLEGAQRRFYELLRDGYRVSLLGQVAKDGMARSTMRVLEALLRLRQAACFGGLVQAERIPDGSAKLDLLMEQLADVIDSGQKALVFSQFTSFLTHVRARLTAAGIDHEYLDGQTRDRRSPVDRFQSEPGCQVFVVSLKAGGTGLNLTAASYVFLLDPWWNPAVEAQAIDRAHRIGQSQPVFAYRLIAQDTIEDKILQLQHSKRELLDGLFAEDAGQLASLTADDLAMLLAP